MTMSMFSLGVTSHQRGMESVLKLYASGRQCSAAFVLGRWRYAAIDDVAIFVLEAYAGTGTDDLSKLLRNASFRRYVPNPRCPVPTGSDDAPAVGAEGRAKDLAPMAGEFSQKPPALRIPDPRCPVLACGDDAPAIGAEGRIIDDAPMAGELSQKPPALRVPDPRRPVFAGGDDASAIGAEGRAKDDAPMAGELSPKPPALGVPDPRRLVRTGGDDAPAIRLKIALRTPPPWPVSSAKSRPTL